MLALPKRSAFAAFSKRPYICSSCLHRARSLPLASGTHPISTPNRSLQTDAQTSPTENSDTTSFRKLLKDAAKKKKKESRESPLLPNQSQTDKDRRLEKWELTVGIEIHAELNTARKLFSRAATSIGEIPNTHVALFDTAFPGSQPQFQKETLIPALRAALALNCDIQEKSSFDRKHYFYQDQPSGYQITQYYEPFAKDGHITLYPHDFPAGVSPEDGPINIGIKQVQMEQDTAKTVHEPPSTHLIDFNRNSHPLIEVITLPQIHNPTIAAACVRKIQTILRTVNAVTAGMEMGGLRADVNVSVRERTAPSTEHGLSYYGVTGLGQRTEIKNLTSIKAVEEAVIAERDRQIELLESGGIVEGETRGWTLGSTTTKRLRGKEGEVDYRYMPDPDIAPVIIGEDVVNHLRDTLPRSSDDCINMLVDGQVYGLTSKDASTLLLLDDGDRLDYYFDVVEILKATFVDNAEVLPRLGKVAGNWVLMELGGLFKNDSWSETRVPSSQLSSIIAYLLRKEITGRTAKLLLARLFEGDITLVDEIIAREDLLRRPLSREEYTNMAQRLIEEKPDMVAAIVEKGQHQKVKWFVGQMMSRGAEGTVEPGPAEEVLRELLQMAPMEQK
ncbi:hypothetical protein K504DRAFT_220577 [Pleomassaria siparia CBS 279.74]|uniref:Glutamyl-tRNA(Gln) amidotransferase subunit B, mitochondrial n=1 Tax=Pleomassaria siparia CBS 279.74 TaxID=1314801 RepID=A0A6G1KF00_9PLEO|nr:hypothetical protein K504DRAFT_220577 [Pleomassaria siparia CBS 279.74]